jgi:glucose/arabinose dehydrogenase
MALDTGVQHMVWMVPTRGFTQPWSMAFLPDGSMLVTDRPGCLRIVRGGALDPRHVAGLPPIQAAGLAGLMDIALHPQFAQNQLVYFTYHKPAATTTVPLNDRFLHARPAGRPGANAGGAGGRGANAPAAAGMPQRRRLVA